MQTIFWIALALAVWVIGVWDSTKCRHRLNHRQTRRRTD